MHRELSATPAVTWRCMHSFDLRFCILVFLDATASWPYPSGALQLNTECKQREPEAATSGSVSVVRRGESRTGAYSVAEAVNALACNARPCGFNSHPSPLPPREARVVVIGTSRSNSARFWAVTITCSNSSAARSAFSSSITALCGNTFTALSYAILRCTQ
jgi:hypothetical protein